MLWRTILADVQTNIYHPTRTGAAYWARVLAKALITPAVQVVVVFRISSSLARWPLTLPLAFILRSVTVVWGGTEIHPRAVIGPGLCLVHSQKVVIGARVVIGSNARIGHGVTIAGDQGRGRVLKEDRCPEVGDDVTVGTDAIIMGPVRVGDGVVIGAQALVVKDVPDRAVVAGSPARVIRMIEDQV